MGIFNRFSKKTDVEKTSKNEPKEISSSGWDAITTAFEEIYPTQKNPKHYGTLIKWRFGGNDPLDGISIYDGGDFWHFVTYGLSELYEKESGDPKISGYGMELTFKLKKDDYEDEEDEIIHICVILQSFARCTYNNGELFKEYEFIHTAKPQGIDSTVLSKIIGFITIPEPCVKSLATPNGSVDFVELIGVTDNELQKIINRELSVNELYEMLGTDVTDYQRDSVI